MPSRPYSHEPPPAARAPYSQLTAWLEAGAVLALVSSGAALVATILLLIILI